MEKEMKLSKILRLLLAAALVLSAVMVLASCEGDALVFGDYDFNDVDDHNPKYADKVYTVSFNSDGADAVEPQSIGRGGKATAPADPVKLGYVFEGWYYQSIKWDFDKYTVRSDITLTAKWTKNNTVYSVSFNTLGGTVIPSQSIKEGRYVLLPDTPVLAEHRFGGWYLGDEPWDFSTPVAGNMTLVAKWIPIVYYTVTFELGAAEPIEPITVAEGNPITVTEPTLARHRFGGWYSGENEWSIDTPVTENITLTAKWIPIVYRTVTFDSNGGTFKGSDASIIDLFKVEDFANGGVKLLAPDDPKRDKSNALTVSKANHFLAGWYTERALIDENDPSKGYTYSGKWDFSSDVLTIDTTKSYTAENSVLTLYAAWVPYYVYEIYAENESGDMALVASTSAINLTIPEWKDGDTSLSMDNFPKRSGYTLNEVFYDEDMTDKVVGTPDKNGKKKTITGEWDAATATSLTPTIKLYTTWDEGERYKIYTAEDLRKNAVAHGYYEIYADLDFTATAWPTVFTDGKFTGTIIGLDDNKTPTERKITGISIESSSRNRLNNGIFGTIDEGARIEKITFENIVHTVNVMEVAPGASFGLFAGSVNGTVIFKDVTVKGKIVIGDNCAELIGTDAVYTISTLAGNGDVSGITHDITTEKANKDNAAFDFEVAEDGTITLKAGSN